MLSSILSLKVQSHRRQELIDITEEVRSLIKTSSFQKGICTVFCPHTTAAVTIQEHADPDVAHDILLWLNRLVPKQMEGFRHNEGNSDAHIKSTLIGPSVNLIIQNGEIILGTWQGIFFCEFDGPRQRTVMVQLLGE
jgi:secondary thiamine-phosphate synthase enzyme